MLVVDTHLSTLPVIVENLDGGDEGFPHIYGPLPTTAVVDVRRAGMIEGTFHVEEGRNETPVLARDPRVDPVPTDVVR